MDVIVAALRLALEATGADRASLVVSLDGGGAEIWGLDGSGEERRPLASVPAQLYAHFDGGGGAELHRDLGSSAFDSDRSLARKGFAEVVRAPLRDADGRTVGILNLIRRRAGGTERDRLFVERLASALSALR